MVMDMVVLYHHGDDMVVFYHHGDDMVVLYHHGDGYGCIVSPW